ncbi:MAG: CCXG family PEP-CTERM protein [Gammaproteobacteria bacterium]|nr:CCXG family PEP-CTERM protein [Gammaproteobacteria bacterium]MCP5138138.1 CCXG family PEP-CTERM protein [Gammaproteobacteria bacterium]
MQLVIQIQPDVCIAMKHFSTRYLPLLAAAAFALVSVSAQAFEIDYSVHSSTYQVNGSESATGLIAAFDASAPFICDGVSMSGFTNVSSNALCGGGSSNLAYRLDVSFTLGESQDISFRAGMDWGKGGGVIADDNLVYLTTDNIWWSYNWSNSDVFTVEDTFDVGSHTLTWIGFEDCCNGMSSIQFKVGAGEWEDLNATNFSAYEGTPSVPVPPALALMLPALGLLRRYR